MSGRRTPRCATRSSATLTRTRHGVTAGRVRGAWCILTTELVFIGAGINPDKIRATLDECLLTDDEWRQWEEIMNRDAPMEEKQDMLCDIFNDGFEDWIDGEAQEHDHDHEAMDEA